MPKASPLPPFDEALARVTERPWITPHDYAALFDTSLNTVYGWLAAGRIEIVPHAGFRYRIAAAPIRQQLKLGIWA